MFLTRISLINTVLQLFFGMEEFTIGLTEQNFVFGLVRLVRKWTFWHLLGDAAITYFEGFDSQIDGGRNEIYAQRNFQLLEFHPLFEIRFYNSRTVGLMMFKCMRRYPQLYQSIGAIHGITLTLVLGVIPIVGLNQ